MIVNQTLRQGPVTKVAVTALATLLSLGVLAHSAIALEIKDSETVDGLIEKMSRVYRFLDESQPSSPEVPGRGDEYTFQAKRGDTIEVDVTPDRGSNLRPYVVLVSPNGKQVAFDSRRGFLRYSVVTPGTYRLRVLARNVYGGYQVTVNGISAGTTATQPTTPDANLGARADQIMEQELRLRSVGCGVPGVSQIQIGSEVRCTLDLKPPQRYVYDAGTKRLIETATGLPSGTTGQPADPNQLAYGRTVSGTISRSSQTYQTTTGLFGQVRVSGPGTEHSFQAVAGDAIRLAVAPDRSNLSPYVVLYDPNGQKAADSGTGTLEHTARTNGNYRIVVIADKGTQGAYTLRLDGSNTSNVGSNLPPGSDPRRQLLVNNGLQVLDSCPTNAIVPLSVVTFHESTGSYTYCLQPTGGVPSGDYTYNATTRRIETDPRVAQMEQNLGLEVTSYCPQQAFGRVELTYQEGGQTYRYCAPSVATRFAAGSYTYQPASGGRPAQVCRPRGFLGLGGQRCVNAAGEGTTNP